MFKNTECIFCHGDDIEGLVNDNDSGDWAHLSCINNALLDPENEMAIRMDHLLEPASDEDFDA